MLCLSIFIISASRKAQCGVAKSAASMLDSLAPPARAGVAIQHSKS
jgi:hypothetical protein